MSDIEQTLIAVLQKESDIAKKRTKYLDKLLAILQNELNSELELLIWSMFMSLKYKVEINRV